MFDPTVWDNLKVVLEGAIYDLDLDGDISIVDRNDIINLAKMSRTFTITFKQSMVKSEYPIATITLEADLDNLAAELHHKSQKPGCYLAICFKTHIHDAEAECPKIEKFLQDIWGNSRKFEQKLSFTYSSAQMGYLNEIIVMFDRKIYEENIDDLLEMIPYILETLQFLANR